jgi:hypothetical protein
MELLDMKARVILRRGERYQTDKVIKNSSEKSIYLLPRKFKVESLGKVFVERFLNLWRNGKKLEGKYFVKVER